MSLAPGADRGAEAVADGFAHLLHDVMGLRVESSLRSRLQRCVDDAAEARGMQPARYLESVRAGGDAMQSLINDITVQESGFFRHPEQFVVLGRDILPGLTAPVRIWSAGCANGQEAFSLAMLLDELGVEGSVVATDLSTAALERTAAAWYADREITGLSTARRDRHLRPDGDGWRVVDAVRARVSTARHNVIEPFPVAVRPCRVVFCRNLLIYLTPEHVRAFLGRVADTYPVGTPLFLGAAEVLWQVTDRFEVVRVDGTFHYRRNDRPAGAGAGSAERVRRTSLPAGPAARTAAAPPAARGAQEWRTGSPRGESSAAPASGGDHPRPPSPALVPTAPAPLVLLPSPEGRLDVDDSEAAAAAALTRAGQLATAAGDHQAAVIAFRACAYLRPQDAIALLHLGLALDAVGARTAAVRAYGAARRALIDSPPAGVDAGGEGYTTAELGRLVDAKLGGGTR